MRVTHGAGLEYKAHGTGGSTSNCRGDEVSRSGNLRTRPRMKIKLNIQYYLRKSVEGAAEKNAGGKTNGHISLTERKIYVTRCPYKLGG